MKMHWSKQKERSADEKRQTRAGNVPQVSGEIRTHLALTAGEYIEPKYVYKAKQGVIWEQCHRARMNEAKARQDNGTWDLVRPQTECDVIPGNWIYKVKLEPSGQVDNQKYAMSQMASTKWRDWTILRLLRLHVSRRHSGFYSNYQQSRAMRCTSLRSGRLSFSQQ